MNCSRASSKMNNFINLSELSVTHWAGGTACQRESECTASENSTLAQSMNWIIAGTRPYIPLQLHGKLGLTCFYSRGSLAPLMQFILWPLSERLGADHSVCGVSWVNWVPSHLVKLSLPMQAQVYAAPGVRSGEPILASYRMDADNPW